MGQEIYAAILTVVVGGLMTVVGYILVKVLDMRLDLTKLQTEVAAQNKLFELQMQLYAKTLRSPHLRDTLDPLIDKFRERGELTIPEWNAFYKGCVEEELIQKDEDKRFAASALKVWAMHKLSMNIRKK